MFCVHCKLQTRCVLVTSTACLQTSVCNTVFAVTAHVLQLHVGNAGTPSRTVMKPSKRVYDAEAAQPGGVRQAEPIVVGSKAPTRTYGAPQTVAAPEGASLGTVAPAPVPVNTSKFGRFRKTGKPVASAVVPGGENTTLFSTPPLASTETAAAPSYAPNYGGVAPMQSSDVVEGGNDNLGKGAWASKGGVVGGNGNTVV